MKSTVSLIFEDLKFTISEGYDQNWSEPSEILNLGSSTTPETVAFTTLIPNLVKPLRYSHTRLNLFLYETVVILMGLLLYFSGFGMVFGSYFSNFLWSPIMRSSFL